MPSSINVRFTGDVIDAVQELVDRSEIKTSWTAVAESLIWRAIKARPHHPAVEVGQEAQEEGTA